jgi:hypothetical protein
MVDPPHNVCSDRLSTTQTAAFSHHMSMVCKKDDQVDRRNFVIPVLVKTVQISSVEGVSSIGLTGTRVELVLLV